MYSLFFSVAPNYSRTFILDLTFDFIHTTPAVSRSVNLGGRKKKKGLPGEVSHAIFPSFLPVDRGLRHDRAVYTNRLRQLIAVVTAENPGTNVSLFNIRPVATIFPVTQSHFRRIVPSVRPYPREDTFHVHVTLTLVQNPTLTISHDRAEDRRCKQASKGQGFFSLSPLSFFLSSVVLELRTPTLKKVSWFQ